MTKFQSTFIREKMTLSGDNDKHGPLRSVASPQVTIGEEELRRQFAHSTRARALAPEKPRGFRPRGSLSVYVLLSLVKVAWRSIKGGTVMGKKVYHIF